MKIINKKALKAAMVKKGLTQTELASRIGICTSSLSYKMNNIKEFTVGEVERICAILDISDDFSSIFFAKQID